MLSLVTFLFAALAGAAEAKAPLTLNDYLAQVRAQSAQGRALSAGVNALELSLRESEIPFSPSLYAQYALFDDRTRPPNQFQPNRTEGDKWRVGVKSDTQIGLQYDAFFQSQHVKLGGLSPLFPTLLDYEQPQFGVQLTQNLWRNGFGRATRQRTDAQAANDRKALLEARYQLKNFLLGAENTYWSLVSFAEIIRLQEENVARARYLRDYMKRKVAEHLMDDTDFLQAEASLEQRELELKTSVDQRAAAVRAFNTYRGAENDGALEPLTDFPKADLLLKTARDPKQRMSREDFREIYEASRATELMSANAESLIAPQLDLQLAVSGNGMSENAGVAQSQALRGENTNWSVGLLFSIPLDYRLLNVMRQSYRVQARQASDLRAQAEYNERRAWADLIKLNDEAQGRFEKANNIERVQSDLVERQRRRMLAGRATTSETTQFEQNLAGAQIARVRAQLELVNNHNLIKQFEEVR